ncbi:hypothetical protein ACQEVF_43935 [Nonomuraea polychroma]|uniref:hypothetical protein n=1 Tax=Nonomuraea polychroma TaxID=46176 RepID=UPI003D8D8BE7
MVVVTAEPIGSGTRYLARWAGSPGNPVEYTRFVTTLLQPFLRRWMQRQEVDNMVYI